MTVATKYPLKPLGEISENHDSKRIPVKASERKPGPYPYYGAQGIVDYVDGYIFDGEYVLVAEDGENLRSRKADIALMARGRFWVNNHAHILKGNGQANTRFLFYAINSADISGYVTGSTIPKLSQRSLNSLVVPCPSTSEQEAIASILGALDDKIELNLRINETLEAMARAIFKDWFVEFGPIRAKAEGRDAYLAPEIWHLFPNSVDHDGIPAGWERVPVGEVIELLDHKRIPLSSRERASRQGPFPYHGATGVMDYIDDYIFDETLLLLGEDGSVVREDGRPYTQYVWGKLWVNNHAHVLRGKGVSVEQLKCFFDATDIAPFVTGAVQAKLNQGNLKRVPFLRADPGIHSAFDAIAAPLFRRIKSCIDESRTLVNIRDLLLPKLMSGEIRLRDAEKAVEAAA